MGLTNQLPPSRLAQAGVIPNAAARPASPYAGQMVFQLDTKQLLIWDGAAWVMAVDTDTPPGLELVKTQTVGTGVSSVTVSDAFSADYDNYLITLSGGVASTSINISLRLGAKTTNYRSQLIYTNWNNTVLADATTTAASFIYAANGMTNGLHGRINVTSPFLTTNTFIESAYTTLNDAGTFRGQTNDTTSYTDFTLLVGGVQTITGGTIRVYGYRN